MFSSVINQKFFRPSCSYKIVLIKDSVFRNRSTNRKVAQITHVDNRIFVLLILCNPKKHGETNSSN